MKKTLQAYRVSTVLMCLLFLGSAGMYLFGYDRIEAAFVALGFPTWIIYPLAVLKILGVIAVVSRRSNFLKELAYAGFLYDAILALGAHLKVGDGEFAPATLAIVLIVLSWRLDRKVHGTYHQAPRE